LTDTDRSPSAPDWSPDGNEFAMIYNPAHPGINFELYRMNANGTNFARLTDSAGYQSYDNPDWSPAGDRILFSADLKGTHDIYMMDPDGSNVQQLTATTVHDRSPAFSPDGTKIAFETYRDGNWEIYLMNADGGEQQRLTHNEIKDSEPAWRP
jgi:Tol biopolymer transport system component